MNNIIFNKNDKVQIFIDLMNIETVCKRRAVDYKMLCMCIAKGRPISCVTAYDAKKEGDLEQEYLHNKLKSIGIRVEIPRVRCMKEGKQAGVDVSLARDVLLCADKGNCDVVIIVSGDGDFVPVLDEVKKNGKKVEVASFDETLNDDLRDSTDRFVCLDDLPIIYPEKAIL